MAGKKTRATHTRILAKKGKVAESNSLSKTRQRLPSEAFAKELQSTPLPSVRKFPQPPRRQRAEQSPRRQHIDLLFNRVVEKYNQPYTPAPTQVGGPLMKASHLDIRKSKEKICKDRQTRREVLFALKKAGKGSNVKEAKWTLASLVRC